MISTAYLYVHEPIVGITACGPFFRDGYDENYGATCLDVAPVIDFNEYFKLEQKQAEDNFLLIVNPDPEFQMDWFQE